MLDFRTTWYGDSDLAKAVVCGDDELLAEIRAKVLQTAGFEADSCLGLETLYRRDDSGAHLFILCSSLAFDARLSAGAWLSERYAGVPVITILRSASEPLGSVGHFLQAHSRPEMLVSLSRSLTSQAS